MSKKHFFYSDIVEVDTLHIELDSMDLSNKEKKHLKGLIESSLHNTVLDAILSELSDEDKAIFLEHLIHNDHTKTWKHLNDKADNIEDKIKQATEGLKKELHKDIRDVKGKD